MTASVSDTAARKLMNHATPISALALAAWPIEMMPPIFFAEACPVTMLPSRPSMSCVWRQVSLSAAATEQGVAVVVADTGIGMDPAEVEIAFQPFGQVDNRLERRYEGTGLGLPLTKALVDLHRAAIVIDSARGHGTRVTVTFPRALTQELAQAV